MKGIVSNFIEFLQIILPFGVGYYNTSTKPPCHRKIDSTEQKPLSKTLSFQNYHNLNHLIIIQSKLTSHIHFSSLNLNMSSQHPPHLLHTRRVESRLKVKLI